MSQYKCIIFDCDGVLIDSELISCQILADMANDYGANIDLAYGMKLFKGSYMQACMEKISKLATKPLHDDFEKEFRQKTFDAFKKEVLPVKGVREVLDNLNVPFCVASSGPENKIRLNLEVTGLQAYFGNNIFSCHTIKKWKPEPDVFLWAAKEMGFHSKECLVIEDSILGVQAAINGGFDVFGYTEHDYNNELKNLATKTFNSMDKLLSMI